MRALCIDESPDKSFVYGEFIGNDSRRVNMLDAILLQLVDSV